MSAKEVIIFLDTETTGTDVSADEIIEVYATVLNADFTPTGRELHLFISPDRDIDPFATKVHGHTNESLAGKPKFADVAGQIAKFLAGEPGESVILAGHNVRVFDIPLLRRQLNAAGHEEQTQPRILDTLIASRPLFTKRSLDAVCDRLGIDRSSRTLHGAKLDVELNIEVAKAIRDQFGEAALAIPEDYEADVPRSPIQRIAPDLANALPRFSAVVAPEVVSTANTSSRTVKSLF